MATENNVRQRSKDIYKSLNAINQEIQARGHRSNPQSPDGINHLCAKVESYFSHLFIEREF